MTALTSHRQSDDRQLLTTDSVNHMVAADQWGVGSANSNAGICNVHHTSKKISRSKNSPKKISHQTFESPTMSTNSSSHNLGHLNEGIDESLHGSSQSNILPVEGISSDSSSDSSQNSRPRLPSSRPTDGKSFVELGKMTKASGQAGEHLVMADLLLNGLDPIKAGEGSSYDIVLIDGAKALKIQVKSTICPRADPKIRYRFSVSKRVKGNGGESLSRKPYDSSEVDIIAFVAIDIRKIAYMPLKDLASSNWNVDFYCDQAGQINHSSRRRFIEDYPITKALKCA